MKVDYLINNKKNISSELCKKTFPKNEREQDINI